MMGIQHGGQMKTLVQAAAWRAARGAVAGLVLTGVAHTTFAGSAPYSHWIVTPVRAMASGVTSIPAARGAQPADSSAQSRLSTTAAIPFVAQTADDAETATAAAIQVFHGVAQADCQPNNPQRLNCVELVSSMQTVAGGIADFAVADPGGIAGFHGILGRGSDGSWKFWFSSQNA
jgi:hypothetical protein